MAAPSHEVITAKLQEAIAESDFFAEADPDKEYRVYYLGFEYEGDHYFVKFDDDGAVQYVSDPYPSQQAATEAMYHFVNAN